MQCTAGQSPGAVWGEAISNYFLEGEVGRLRQLARARKAGRGGLPRSRSLQTRGVLLSKGERAALHCLGWQEPTMRKPNFWRTWQRGVDPAEVAEVCSEYASWRVRYQLSTRSGSHVRFTPARRRASRRPSSSTTASSWIRHAAHQEKVHRHMGHRRPTMATWVPASPAMPATGVRLRGNRAFIWVCRTYGRLEVVGSGDG